MKARKILAMVAALALTAALAVGGTLAYLTSTKTVTNTFTVGNVQIKLDEAKVDANGKALASGERVEGVADTATAGNTYHLLPGHTYDKDPTVTVLKGSEESYVRMLVTIDKQAALDAIFDKLNEGKAENEKLTIESVFGGVSADWNLVKETENGDDTRTYEFRHNTTVKPAADQDAVLDDLFETITVPGGIDNTQLDTIKGLSIKVVAQAIQADGFNTADAAWAAFSA